MSHDIPASSAAIIDTGPIPAPSMGIGFWPRVAARLLDVVFGMAVSFPIAMMAGVILAILAAAGVTDGGWVQRMQQAGIGSVVVGIISGILFHTLCDALCGTTPGKLALGLRVVDRNGKRPTMLQSFKRELAYLVDAFFFGLVAHSSMSTNELRQRVGDRWADTLVISAAEARTHEVMTPGRIAAGILLACCADALLTISWMVFTAA